jgi:putative spermidine/putrescine transport system substrate-binding protein
MNRKMLGLLTSIAALAALPASPSSAEQITVATYGGSWGEQIQKCIMDPFTKATGIDVLPEPGVSTVTLSKLQQQKDDPAIDVAWIDGGISELAVPADVVDEIDPARVPNVAKMEDAGIYKTDDGKIYALSTGFYALGVTYNTEEVKETSTSWWDLWKPEYAGKVTIPSPVNAAGIPFFVHLTRLAGGDFENTKPGVEKLKALDVSSYFDSSGVASSSFQSGEVIIGAHYNAAAWGMADKGLPIAYVAPKEGPTASDIRVHLVKGSKHKEAAEQFINFAVDPAQASCLANNLYVGPATKGVELTEKARQRMPWGPDGSVANLALFNWNEVNKHREELTEIWNREIAGQ